MRDRHVPQILHIPEHLSLKPTRARRSLGRQQLQARIRVARQDELVERRLLWLGISVGRAWRGLVFEDDGVLVALENAGDFVSEFEGDVACAGCTVFPSFVGVSELEQDSDGG